jgi:hypothetical protein
MPQRNRVTRVKIHNPAVIRLLKQQITEDIMDIARELLPHIASIYTDENGEPYVWNVKYDTNARAKRMYGVIYCENPDPKYKEAARGEIAKYLKSISTKDKIKVQYQGGGIRIG